MKITRLQIENFKRISAVEIRPDGALVEITGKNAQGKSSVLDAILAAIGGTRNIQMVPIRLGAQQALIRLETGDLKITRTFKVKEGLEYTTTLKVETADGKVQPSPQDLLNTLAGPISYDPLEFERAKPDEQFDMIKRLVTTVDFDAIAAADKEDREERTVLNRRAKELRAQAEGIVLPAGATPKTVNVGPLEARLGEAADHNADIERRRAEREHHKTVMDAHLRRAEEIEAQIAALQRSAMAERESAKALQDKLDTAEPLPEPIDVSKVQADLGNARQGNAVAERARQKADLSTKAQEAEDASKALTKRMEGREADKQKAIAAVKMPVKGLGFGDGFITLGGVPFEQASQAERLRAAMGIAVALNPKLRVIRVQDGSRLDADALKELAAFAEQQDFQCWVETVGSGPSGFIIEDGHLQGEAPEPEPEPEEAI